MFDIPYQVPSRRTFLSLSALSAIAIAASPEMPDAFASPDPDIWSALCEKWTDIITGRNAAKTADPRARAIIAKTDKRVATILTDLAQIVVDFAIAINAAALQPGMLDQTQQSLVVFGA